MWRAQVLKKAQISTIILKTLNPQTISPQLQNPQRIYPGFISNTNNQTRVLPKPQIWRYDLTGKFSTFSGGNEITKRCLYCKSEKKFLVCESCGRVQPVDKKIDYFTIFGLERRFDIDEGSLKGTYLNWSQKLRYLVHTRSMDEIECIVELFYRDSDAYHTLSKPLKRAIYLMRLEGVEVDEEQTVSEPELLGEIMEIREAVKEATNSQDLNKIHSEMEKKQSHWSDMFGKAFENKKHDEALKAIQRMTYYDRVKEEIVKKRERRDC